MDDVPIVRHHERITGVYRTKLLVMKIQAILKCNIRIKHTVCCYLVNEISKSICIISEVIFNDKL